MADNACVDAICHRLSWTNGATVRGWQSLTGCSAADVQSALDALVDQGALVVLYEFVLCMGRTALTLFRILRENRGR